MLAALSGVGGPSMSGIVTGIDYSLLFPSSSSDTLDAASNILATLYSGSTVSSGSSTFASSGNPLTDLQLAQADETQDVAQEAKNPTVIRAIDNFTKAIANSSSIQQALENPDILTVLLTANGLSSEASYTALAKQALLSNPDDPTSLANQLGTQWQQVNSTYNFYGNGLAELQNPTVQQQIIQQYEQVTWMNSLDAATPGLAEALEFKQQASSITSVADILDDPINSEVVLTALGIPQEIYYQDTTAQDTAITSRLSISDFQNPQFVNSLTDQYLLAMQQQSATSSTGTTLTSLAVSASSGIVV